MIARSSVALVLASLAAAQQPIVQTVYNSGSPQSRYDMVILGDGYQAFEQTRFNQDVQQFLTALFQKQPYATFASYYNVHTVFRASAESGADQPDVNPPIYRNTVYDCTYNYGGTDRCLYVQNTSQALADAALAPANEGRVLMFVNDSRYGGCASTFAVSYNGGSMTEVQIHELGHSLGGLADEYDYAGQTYTGSEPGEANVTISTTGQKWSHWFGTESIGAFQGARYCQFGIYRPRSNCLMRSLGTTLCAVCREQITKTTNSIADTIDQFSPPTTSVTLNSGATQLFSITHFVPAGNNPVIAWKLDGSVVAGAGTTSYLLDTTSLALGSHTVEASVRDQTVQVRNDPGNQMRELQTWNVTVSNPAAAQLRMPSFSGSQIWVQPGVPITLTTTIANDGPSAAGSFDVEFFASTLQPWTTQDIYLGKITINGLGVAQQVVQQHACQVPWRIEPRLYYLHAILDRANSVLETNELDNLAVTALIGQVGACTTKLEFADPLLYPGDAAAIPVVSGGSRHPTVISRCANPNTLYLIVWGTSGTIPGTPIAPGLTVPINQDFTTQLGLAVVNGAWFQNFLGVLDAEGIGRATFFLPPSSGLLGSQGHFAALLVDPVMGFSAVSNPVAITLQ